MQRKTRTREHVIASQSVAHVEKFIVNAGHTTERFVNDYGYDLSMTTFAPDGGVEPGSVLMQLKATETLRLLRDGRTISFAVEWSDLAQWREELMPVILILHDVRQDRAYWLYVQQSCESSSRLQGPQGSGYITLYLSSKNALDEQAIEKFRQFKQDVFDQTRGKVKRNG